MVSQVSSLVVDEPGRFMVNSRAYTDPDLFEREMELIFERSWVFLAHESQLPQPNDYLTTRLGRQPVVVCRDSDGELRAFLNRCRHRGAVVCRADAGNSSRFRCFYHGWTYKNTGELLAIPDRAAYPETMDLTALGLVPVPRLATYKGFVFGSLSVEGPSLEEHLGNARPYLDLVVDRYPEGIVVLKGASRYGFRGNWKLQVENALDFYHLPFVHASFFELNRLKGKPVPTFATMANDQAVYLGGGHAVTVSRHRAPLLLEAPDQLEKRLGPVRARWAQQCHMHLFIFPNLVILENPSLQLRVIRPVAVDETEVIGYAFAPVGASEEMLDRQLRAYEAFFGPVGMGTPDDIQVFHACMQGFQAGALPWNDLSKGISREARDGDLRELGPFEFAGNITDDTVSRGFFRWWARLLGAGTDGRMGS